jgi:hypothetical protein
MTLTFGNRFPRIGATSIVTVTVGSILQLAVTFRSLLFSRFAISGVNVDGTHFRQQVPSNCGNLNCHGHRRFDFAAGGYLPPLFPRGKRQAVRNHMKPGANAGEVTCLFPAISSHFLRCDSTLF